MDRIQTAGDQIRAYKGTIMDLEQVKGKVGMEVAAIPQIMIIKAIMDQVKGKVAMEVAAIPQIIIKTTVDQIRN